MDTTYNIIDGIGEHIEPMRKYTILELVPHLGVSRAAINRLINAHGGLRARFDGKRWTILGKHALEFCRTHEDYLALYSNYNGRKKSAKTRAYLRKRGKRRSHDAALISKMLKQLYPSEKRGLSGLRTEVYDCCERLQFNGEKVTVRRVMSEVKGRTQHVCRYVRQWKNKTAGLKPKKAA